MERYLFRVCELLHSQREKDTERLQNLEQVVTMLKWNNNEADNPKNETNKNMEALVQKVIDIKERVDGIKASSEDIYVSYQGDFCPRTTGGQRRERSVHTNIYS